MTPKSEISSHNQTVTMTTTNAQRMSSFHSDFVHDIQFDFYGRRIATCSGDRSVKVWNLEPNGKFSSSSEIQVTSTTTNISSSGKDGPMNIQAHRSAVWRVSWAHPEYGQILATCGADGSAVIWEEVQIGGEQSATAGPSGAAFTGGANGMTNNTSSEAFTSWVEKAKLLDARRSVSTVQFAPRHLGLLLATGSADGFVRIYEAIDVMNLNHWPLKGSIELEDGNNERNELGVTAISWCNGRFEPPTLVVGGSSGSVLIYRYSDSSRNWNLALKLKSHSKGVLDVAWAPNVGRTYHLIASVGMDGKTVIHRLKRGKKGDGERTLELESNQELDSDTESSVWRCKWNVTGTVLATSGDFGLVKLWKSDFRRNTWKCVSEVIGDVDSTTTMSS